MTSEYEKVPKWVEQFEVDDPADGQWLVNYLTNRGIKIYRHPGESMAKAAKRILIGLFKEERPDHYKLLRNIQESYRQRSKRKDKTEYLDRTYRLSRESVEKLNGLSNKLGVSGFYPDFTDTSIKRHNVPIRSVHDQTKKIQY